MCHVVAKFNPSHGVNFWVRCASGNVLNKSQLPILWGFSQGAPEYKFGGTRVDLEATLAQPLISIKVMRRNMYMRDNDCAEIKAFGERVFVCFAAAANDKSSIWFWCWCWWWWGRPGHQLQLQPEIKVLGGRAPPFPRIPQSSLFKRNHTWIYKMFCWGRVIDTVTHSTHN